MEISKHLRARDCPVCCSEDQSDIAFPARIEETKLDDFAFASRKLPEFMHLRLIRCRKCHVLYASPAFVPEFLAQAYHRAAYDSSNEADYAAATYAAYLPSILRKLDSRDVAVEIGSGNGSFLAHLKAAGFRQVIGIEPSREAVAVAEPALRSMIRCGTFNAGDFEAGTVDLFACFQTIEHVENPHALCSDAYRLLRSKGAVFFIGHDYKSWVNRLLGESSPIFDVEHLQLFSKDSIQYLLESCHYSDIQIGTIWNSYPLTYWFKLLPVPTSLKRRLMSSLRALHVGDLPVRINVGNIYAIGFKV